MNYQLTNHSNSCTQLYDRRCLNILDFASMGKTLPIENIAPESAEVVSGACEQSKS